VAGCWDNVGFGQAVWGNIILEIVGIGEDDVGTHNGVLGCTKQHKRHVGVYGTRRVGCGHGWEQRSFDDNINIGHVLCYDIVCTMWIGQQNSGSTNGKRRLKNTIDVFISKKRNRGYSKEE
jgi:hypothetical protein